MPSRRIFVSGSGRTLMGCWVLLLCALGHGVSQESATDLSGRPFNLGASALGKAVALVFLRTDCPISARYAPTIQQLSQQYRNNVSFYLVFPDKTESPAAIRKYLREYGYSIPALRDPGHSLVKLAQARITPEAAVFDPKSSLIYHGRVDNLYVDVTRARPHPTTHEFDDALQAATHGLPLLAKEAGAVGCYISDLP